MATTAVRPVQPQQPPENVITFGLLKEEYLNPFGREFVHTFCAKFEKYLQLNNTGRRAPVGERAAILSDAGCGLPCRSCSAPAGIFLLPWREYDADRRRVSTLGFGLDAAAGPSLGALKK